ncbi:MAG TPA: hypothetical protein VMG82_38415 [Candidatus Sulfotelmatobacter sp.]|nr:hypothetical protein [Candidatus Sulfotelmatobacter sp.]
MHKRHVNRSWGTTGVTPMQPATDSSFEMTAKTMGLSPAQYKNSLELREWARANRQRKYVPPDLLMAWGFEGEQEL